MIIYPGQSVKLSASFTVDGAAADPTAIELDVLDPSGTTNAYTYALAQITKDSTGHYHKHVTLDEEGVWKWRWSGTGNVIAAEEGEIRVKRSEFV